MKFAREKRPAVDWMFTLTLFGLFVVAALTLVVIGAQVYRSTADSMNQNYTSRTALSYVTEKVRQSDAAGAVSVGKIGEDTALILRQEIGGEAYNTYIYCHDHSLKELLARASLPVSPGDGQTIMELEAFQVEQVSGSLFRFTVTGMGQEAQQALISPRGNEAER